MKLAFSFNRETEQLRNWEAWVMAQIVTFIRPWECQNMMSDVPNGNVMMEAHARRTGLVDSIRALTRLVESHTQLTWTAGFVVTKNRISPWQWLLTGPSLRRDEGFTKMLNLLPRHMPTGVTHILNKPRGSAYVLENWTYA